MRVCVHNLSKCVFIDARAACACVRAFACVCLRVYLSVYNMVWVFTWRIFICTHVCVCSYIRVFVCVHIHVPACLGSYIV